MTEPSQIATNTRTPAFSQSSLVTLLHAGSVRVLPEGRFSIKDFLRDL